MFGGRIACDFCRIGTLLLRTQPPLVVTCCGCAFTLCNVVCVQRSKQAGVCSWRCEGVHDACWRWALSDRSAITCAFAGFRATCCASYCLRALALSILKCADPGVFNTHTIVVLTYVLCAELTDDRGGGDRPRHAPETDIGLHMQTVGFEVGVT